MSDYEILPIEAYTLPELLEHILSRDKKELKDAGVTIEHREYGELTGPNHITYRNRYTMVWFKKESE